MIEESEAFQWLFNAVFMFACFLGGWVLNRISTTIDRLDEDVRAMPEKYVSKVDYHEDLHNIHETLLRIEGKLDGKADK